MVETYPASLCIRYEKDNLTEDLMSFDIQHALCGAKGLFKEAMRYAEINDFPRYSIATTMEEFGFKVEIIDNEFGGTPMQNNGILYDVLGMKSPDDGVLCYLRDFHKRDNDRLRLYKPEIMEFSNIHAVRRFIDMMISPVINYQFFSMIVTGYKAGDAEFNRYVAASLRIPNEMLI